VEGLLQLLKGIGTDPGDEEDLRLRKALVVVTALFMSAMGLLWAAIYLVGGEPGAAAFPLMYSVLSFLSIAIFSVTRQLGAFANSQLLLILVLPFLMVFVLGGLMPSSAVVMWSFLAPLGALAFIGPRAAAAWLAAFLLAVAASGLFGEAVRSGNALPEPLVRAFFILNICGVALVSFSLLVLFVRERDRALGLVRRLLGQYLSPTVVRTLMADRGERLGGAIVEVTALFADLGGFTPFAERTPPEEVVDVLNRYYGAALPLIAREGGTIVQLQGDAILAIFNAPVPQVRHALHAARAGLAVQGAIAEIAAGSPELPRFRMGINTGLALVGNVGSLEYRAFTAHGDAVNVAARLQALAEPGAILVSASTYALIRDRAEAGPVERVSLKGKREEVEACRLLRIREAAGPALVGA
jgi:class 3 adenylate cyclase